MAISNSSSLKQPAILKHENAMKLLSNNVGGPRITHVSKLSLAFHRPFLKTPWVRQVIRTLRGNNKTKASNNLGKFITNRKTPNRNRINQQEQPTGAQETLTGKLRSSTAKHLQREPIVFVIL
jgi:hypothetical protein